MSLQTLTTYKTPKYLNTLEGRALMIQHIEYLRSHPDTEIINIDTGEARPYYYCLDAFLLSKGYDSYQVYPTLLLNGLDSVEEFNSNIATLIIPSIAAVEEIVTIARV